MSGSFLPYSGGGTGGWIGAFSVSAVSHVAIVAGMVTLYNQTLELANLQSQQAAFDISVALEQLDSDSLEGVTEEEVPEEVEPEVTEETTDDYEDEGPEEEEPEIPEDLEPETPEEVEPEVAEIPEDMESETIESAEAETVEALPEAETVEETVTETLEETPSEPDPFVAEEVETAALEPAPVTPDPVAIEPSLSSPLSDGDDGLLSPLEPDNSGLLTVGPATVGADAGGFDTGLIATGPVEQDIISVVPTEPDTGGIDAGVDVVEAAVGTDQGAAIGGTPPEIAAPPPPSAQDLALTDLIRRIRLVEGDACLAALPQRDGPEGVGLSLLGDNDIAMEAFSNALLTAADDGTRQTRALVDDRQCAAISYIQNNVDYPATRLGLRLDADRIDSGGRLTGVLRGTPGRFVMLMLIDDNGVVQDLQRFTATSGDFYRFDVPVTRDGPARDTKNILMAVAFTEEPTELRARMGQLAQDVFSGLPDPLADGAEMAVATFDVR